MSDIITLEVLIATPPTSKCDQTVEVLKEIVRQYPDETRLIVFRRGIDFLPEELQMHDLVIEEDSVPKEASLQMRTLINKGRAVPTVVVAGEFFSTAEPPHVEELQVKVEQLLQNKAK